MLSFVCRVCVCERREREKREREREKEREREEKKKGEREEREKRERGERERERGSHLSGVSFLNRACLQTHTSFITVSVTRICSSFGLELMLKLSTLLTIFTFILKAEVLDYGKGRYISNSCLWYSANHDALGQLANQRSLCLLEGGALTCLREAGHRGSTIMYNI